MYKQMELSNYAKAQLKAIDWKEELHPRSRDGKFAPKGQGEEHHPKENEPKQVSSKPVATEQSSAPQATKYPNVPNQYQVSFHEPLKSSLTRIRNIGFQGEMGDSSQLSPALMTATADKLTELDNKYGFIKNNPTTIFYDNYMNEYVVASVSSSYTDPWNFTLNLNARKYGLGFETEHLDNKRYGAEQQKCMPCADENYKYYTVTHEYGHIIQRMFYVENLKKAGWTEDNPECLVRDSFRFSPYETYMKIKSDTDAGIKRDIINKASKIYAKNGGTGRYYYSREISENGCRNDAEFFAECFANSQLGKPNCLGLATLELLKERGL